MEWVETTGRTLEEAKDAALDQLGVDENDAEFEVLEEPKVGLFGRMRNEARVRARIRPTSPRSKEDGRDRRRRRSKPSSSALASERASDAVTSFAQVEGEGTTMETDVPLSEQAELGREFLSGLLDAFALTGTIEVRDRDEDTAELAVTGQDLGLLIGPQGATLNAVQELTRTVVQRRTGARNGRLVVEVAGYRQKRREALERFVEGVAEEVRRTGTRTALDVMHAADRKVVHDAVNALEGVSSMSEGEDPYRRVVIEPSAS